MRKKGMKYIKLVVTLGLFITILSSNVFAAWMGIQHYEWAKSVGITTLASNSSLSSTVSHANFYSILIKYLQYRGYKRKDNVKQNVGASNSYNKTLDGMNAVVDSYISKTELTPTEYRKVLTYIEHVEDTVDKNAYLLSRDNLKDFHLYLSLAKYKAATLINEYSYKNYVMSNMGKVKYKEIVDYNIKPYYAQITRGEFLVLMFSLLSERELSADEIINEFYESGVLEGYLPREEGKELELNKALSYAEMFTFMHRFDVFDFNAETETETEENVESDEDTITLKR